MIKLKNNCKNLEKITFKTETIIWYHTGDQYESKFQERSLNRPLPKFPETVQEKTCFPITLFGRDGQVRWSSGAVRLSLAVTKVAGSIPSHPPIPSACRFKRSYT